ncbi:MAG: hypothetical protein D6696_16035 [Acidobacteria bacterium]|nr:MAG: hypothetical protein D6696_16035 [Acidobacteriota bacterium]
MSPRHRPRPRPAPREERSGAQRCEASRSTPPSSRPPTFAGTLGAPAEPVPAAPRRGRPLATRAPGPRPAPWLLVALALIVPGIAPLVAEEGKTPVAGDPSAWNAVPPERPAAVVVRGATIWTSGPQGVLDGADLLVVDGVIKAVGTDLKAPADALVIDGAGKHVSAGIIDAHSHSAIVGDVNEATHVATPEVRIENLIDAESINIYRQLAGGVTTVNLLHGSANAIGGQNAVIKLRWGAGPRELLFAEAPAGVKFALGENPKQSNWGDDNQRFPQTRQGVEEAIDERFRAALDYRRAWRDYEAAKDPQRVPPRRDLQLEAMLEMLDGKRLIHSHSYRHDEILMLLDLMASYGIRIATFQHVLEGYKVADELARHGAGASTFSDWWAYKYEVIDAIPWNGAIMWDRGVVVSYNSDSDELARHLNLEAAKAVRYGGVPPAEALKFVTLNPARQLHVDRWVGSLEPGKHADFVLWSGSPLSTRSIVLQTWVDGRKYFDRQADLAGRAVLAEERRKLIAEVEASGSGEGGDQEGKDDDGAGGRQQAEDEPPPPPAAQGREVQR